MGKILGGNLTPAIGGYLQCWNWAGSSGVTSATPRPINYTQVDVAWWKLKKTRAFPPLTYSGCHGAMRRRMVVRDWLLTARIWWDYDNAPEYVFNQGDTLAVKLTIGNDVTWTGKPTVKTGAFQGGIINQQVAGLPANGFGILPAGATFLPCYCSPMAVWEGEDLLDSSEGNEEDGIFYADIQISGDSNMWTFVSANNLASYTSYVQSLMQQSFIATNVGS